MVNKKTALIFVTSFLSIPVFASDFYILGNYSQSKFKVGDYDESALISVHQSNNLVLIKDSDTSLGVGVGYHINDNVSFELAYNDLGSSVLENTATSHSSDGLIVYEKSIYNTVSDWDSIQASFIAKRPLTKSLQLYGRLGTVKITEKSETKYSMLEREYMYREKSSINRALFGVGVGYEFNERILFRVEYDRYLSARWEYISSSASLGIVHSF